MKRYIPVLLVLILLLGGCTPAEDPGITDGTNPTRATSPTQSKPTTQPTSQPTTQPTAQPTTQPTAQPTTQPTNPAQADELSQFDALFGDFHSWYNAAIYDQYESPAQLSMWNLFYDGFDGEKTATDAEWEQLKDRPGFHKELDFFRLPVKKMDEVLTNYFGITTKNLPAECFGGLTYLESTDCYYLVHGDTKIVTNFKATGLETLADGTMRLTYTTGNHKSSYVVTLKQNGDGYILLSNVFVG